eukprot:1160525-Pelagomonas_calceolata.AAC.1
MSEASAATQQRNPLHCLHADNSTAISTFCSRTRAHQPNSDTSKMQQHSTLHSSQEHTSQTVTHQPCDSTTHCT